MSKHSMKTISSAGRWSGVILLLLGLTAGLASCAAPIQQEVKRGLRTVESARYGGGDPHGQAINEVNVPPLSDSADLYEMLQYAALNNPGLEADFHRWKAAAEKIPQVTSLSDPRFSFGQFFEEVETRVGPQKQRFGLSQMFPWFGTLRLRGDIAAHNALIAEQRFQATEDRLFLEVVTAYAEYFYLNQSISITAELIELISNAEAVAQAKYRAGVGPYADVIRAQVELGRLEDQFIALKDRERPVIARLNAALNRPLDTALPSVTVLPEEGIVLTDDELIESARANNPSLQALNLVVQRERRAIDLAGRRYYPNFSLGFNYLNTGKARMTGVDDSGKDAVLGMFSINIPIWRGSYGAGVREAHAKRRAAELDRINRENQILAGMRDVLFTFHDAERKISLYRDALIPKARQSVEASATGYEAGEIDFLNFLDAERILLEFQLAYDRSRADRLERLAELRVLVGGAYQQTTDK